jgi:Tfp pilus assembly protein PilE
MIYAHRLDSGFTAVELLTTLFVAAAFLVAGYQLFNVVMKDSGEARLESSVSNVAYDYLRRYTASATNPCTASTPLTNQTVAITDFSDVTASLSVVISCPQASTPSLSKIEVTVTYGVGVDANTLKRAVFVDKSVAAIPSLFALNRSLA